MGGLLGSARAPRFSFLVLVALLLPAGAFAWPPTWGAELTFTDDIVQEGDHGEMGMWPWAPENQAALERFWKHAKKALRGRPDIGSVRYLEGEDKWGHDVIRVQYTDGWHFDVTLDPYCLEVVPKYFTLQELKRKYRRRIERDIFGLMKDVGLVPRRMIGGGHLHMGADSTFENDVLFFRNWVVDTANHPELALGGFERDFENASPYLIMSASQKTAFLKHLAKTDRDGFGSVRNWATDFVAKVLFDGKPATGQRIMDNKYWQLNLLRLAALDTEGVLDANARWKDYEAWILFDDVPKGARTVEIRPMRAQQSVEDLILDVELFEGRLRYIRSLKTPLALSTLFLAGKEPRPEDGAAMLHGYMLDAKVSPADYVARLPVRGDGIDGGARWRKAFEKLVARDCRAVVAAGE